MTIEIAAAPEMDRASEICRAINARAFLAMGLSESPKLPPLRGVSLSEMLEAARLVRQRNELTPSVNGVRQLHVVPADRLIAAVFVGLSFEADATPVVIEPRRDMFGEWRMNAVAVVDLTEKADVEPERASA